MSRVQYAGNLGHHGYSRDSNYNKKVDKANALVDQYNQKVADLPICKQLDYQKEILREIREILIKD